jgi:hypothetical protein
MRSAKPNVGDIWHCAGDFNQYFVLVLEIEWIPQDGHHSYLCLQLHTGRKISLRFNNEAWTYTYEA